MTEKHIMITSAIRQPNPETPEMPAGAVYNPSRGYWMKDGKPMVADPRYRTMTKKRDLETGEDEKST